MKLYKYSPITWLFMRFFGLLRILPPQLLLYLLVKNRASLTPAEASSRTYAARRAWRVEAYIAACVLFDLLAFSATFVSGSIPWWIGLIWSALRCVDILQSTVNV